MELKGAPGTRLGSSWIEVGWGWSGRGAQKDLIPCRALRLKLAGFWDGQPCKGGVGVEVRPTTLHYGVIHLLEVRGQKQRYHQMFPGSSRIFSGSRAHGWDGLRGIRR